VRAPPDLSGLERGGNAVVKQLTLGNWFIDHPHPSLGYDSLYPVS
jgi:hypothetical protein